MVLTEPTTPLIFMRNPVGLFIACIEKEVVIKTTSF